MRLADGVPLLFRLILRCASLAFKFALTIVIARKLGFDAVGAYGLAIAVSVVSSKLLGLGFSAEINRRLSGPEPLVAIRVSGVLAVLYAALYLVLCGAIALALSFGLSARIGLHAPLLWGVALVALSEHAALEANSYVFSLHRAAAASVLLFVRTGAWASIAIAGLLLGTLQTIESVFALWFAANVGVVLAAGCLIVRARMTLVRSGLREQQDRHTQPSRLRADVLSIWRHGLPFFAAVTLLSLLQYLERFVASGVLDPTALGRYVFAWSIANAVQTLAFASITAIGAPRLVQACHASPGEFRALLQRMMLAAAALTLAISAAILAASPLLYTLAHERASRADTAGLGILLVSFVLRSLCDVMWAAAVALRVGGRVAAAMAAIVVLCAPAAWGLMVWLGVTGAALAHLTASMAIALALASVVMRAQRPKPLPEQAYAA
ncbi:polysaccharide biosynthesis protein [Paraburkholderia hayleyella]|uniref:polysaccharide biosynthesis protein n=1 Tax=Paraburkholderia hayleyella TaxID=2152889 RepID=UPI0015803917|nr:polysaccharide biosynthesis protein [Paraburkholderia hayleyella]